MSVYNIDFDKTLTDPDEDEWAPAFKRKPNDEMLAFVEGLYINGDQIIVWTARQWREAPQIVGWLIAHEVPFHGVMCGKGGSDHYVDDKAITPEEAVK